MTKKRKKRWPWDVLKITAKSPENHRHFRLKIILISKNKRAFTPF